MNLSSETIERFRDIFGDEAIKEDYSGRAMYGDTTLGLVAPTKTHFTRIIIEEMEELVESNLCDIEDENHLKLVNDEWNRLKSDLNALNECQADDFGKDSLIFY